MGFNYLSSYSWYISPTTDQKPCGLQRASKMNSVSHITLAREWNELSLLCAHVDAHVFHTSDANVPSRCAELELLHNLLVVASHVGDLHGLGFKSFVKFDNTQALGSVRLIVIDDHDFVLDEFVRHLPFISAALDESDSPIFNWSIYLSRDWAEGLAAHVNFQGGCHGIFPVLVKDLVFGFFAHRRLHHVVADFGDHTEHLSHLAHFLVHAHHGSVGHFFGHFDVHVLFEHVHFAAHHAAHHTAHHTAAHHSPFLLRLVAQWLIDINAGHDDSAGHHLDHELTHHHLLFGFFGHLVFFGCENFSEIFLRRHLAFAGSKSIDNWFKSVFFIGTSSLFIELLGDDTKCVDLCVPVALVPFEHLFGKHVYGHPLVHHSHIIFTLIGIGTLGILGFLSHHSRDAVAELEHSGDWALVCGVNDVNNLEEKVHVLVIVLAIVLGHCASPCDSRVIPDASSSLLLREIGSLVVVVGQKHGDDASYNINWSHRLFVLSYLVHDFGDWQEVEFALRSLFHMVDVV